jgi:ribonuclease HI
MSDTTWTIYTDGGSRGNPGPAAYAYVIKRPGETDIEERCYLGDSTNNIAEYTGLVKALEHARELGGRKLLVHSDSELMVKQMNGQYRVKNEGLLPLYRQADRLRNEFASVIIKHVRREYNKQADALCNEAMDNPRACGPRTPAKEPAEPAVATVAAVVAISPVQAPPLSPFLQALEVLRQNAALWATGGDPTSPAPVDVLNRLCEIMKSS